MQLIVLMSLIYLGQADFFTTFKSTNVSEEQASNGRIESLQENNVLSCLVKCKRIETCNVVGVDSTNSVAGSLVSCHLYEINNSSNLTNYVYSSESDVYIKDYVDDCPGGDFESTLTSLASETSTSSDSISTDQLKTTAMSTIRPPIAMSTISPPIAMSQLTESCIQFVNPCSGSLNCVNFLCTPCTSTSQYYSFTTYQCTSCGVGSFFTAGTNCYRQVSTSEDTVANHNATCVNAGLDLIIPPATSIEKTFFDKAVAKYFSSMTSGYFLTNAKYVSTTNPVTVINLSTNEQYTPATGVCSGYSPKVGDVVIMFGSVCISGSSSPATDQYNSFCQKAT